MRVLGVDPGLTRCGVAVVDGAPGRRLQMVDVGVLRTAADVPLAYRLLEIERQLERWVARTQPDVVAIERVFSQQNVRTVMGTAQASAVAMLVAARCSIPVALHTPSEVKAAVSGNGRAGKAQVAAMVMHLLRLECAPTPADASDALALAICQVWRGPAADRIQQALERTQRAQAGAARQALARAQAQALVGGAGS